MSEEEMWAFKDEVISAIAEIYERIPGMVHHSESDRRSAAAEVIGRCHRAARESLEADVSNPST